MAAPIVAQSVFANPSAAASTLTTTAWAAPTTAGSTILLCVAVHDASSPQPTITPPAGYVALGPPITRTGGTPTSDQVTSVVYVRENAPALTGTLTVTLSAARLAEVFAFEIASVPSSSTIEAVATNVGTGLSIDSPAIVTAYNATELVLHFAASGNAASTMSAPTNSFTQVIQKSTSVTGSTTITAALFQRATTAKGSYATSATLSGTTSRPWTSWLIAVKPADAAPPPQPAFQTSGVGIVRRGWSGQETTVAIPNLATAQAWAQTLSIATTNPGTSKLGGFADDMLIANPLLRIGGYFKSVQNQAMNGVGLPEQWYTHTTSSQTDSTVRENGASSSIYLMNPPDSGSSPTAGATNQAWADTTNAVQTLGVASGATYHGWVEFHPQYIKRSLQDENDRYAGSDPFSFAWLDSCGSFSLKNQNIPGTTTKYTAQSTRWYGLVRNVVDGVKALNGVTFVNGESNPGIEDHADGVMSENWMRAATAGPVSSTNFTDSKFTSEVDSLKGLQASGTTYAWALSKFWESTAMTTAQKTRWTEILAAGYFLGDDGRAFLEINWQDGIGPWTVSWPTVLDVDLGTPTETQATTAGYRITTLANGGYVYGRYHSKGAVFVNTSTVSVTVTLDRGDYRTYSGTLIGSTSLIVPALSAMVLTHPTGVPNPPVSTSAPILSPDSPTTASTITTSDGSWSPPATSLSYKWQTATAVDGTGAADVSGAATNTLAASALGGRWVRSGVLGANADGPAAGYAYSAWMFVSAITYSLVVTDPATSSTSTTGPAGTTYTIRGTVSGFTIVAVNGSPASLAGDGSWSLAVALAVGANTVTIDASGGGGSPSTVTRTITLTPVDTTAPDLSVTTPSADGTVSNATTTQTVAGSVSDSESGVASVTVNGTSTPFPGGAFSTSIALVLGANTITVTATDAAGNQRTVSRTVTRLVTPTPPDTTAPSVQITNPSGDRTLDVALPYTLTLSGTASDDTSLASVVVNGVTADLAPAGGLYPAAGLYPSPTLYPQAATGQSWTATVTLTEATTVLTARATDATGNQASTSRTVTVRAIDTTPPSLTIATQDGSLTGSIGDAVAFSGTVSDNVAVATVNANGISAIVSGSSWTVGVPMLSFGANVVTVTAFDAAGNSTSASRTIFLVPIAALDRTPPNLLVSSPPTDLEITSSGGVSYPVAGMASDNESGLASVTVNGLSVAVDSTTGAFSSSVTLQSPTTTIIVVAADNAGNLTTLTRTIVLSTDSGAISVSGDLLEMTTRMREAGF